MPGRRSLLTVPAILLLALAGAATHPAAALAQGAANPAIAFDIPAQPLDSALAAYFRITGVQLLYTSTVVAQHRSTAIRGRYTARAALQLLLAGTGLVARYGRQNAVFIGPPDPAAMSAPIPLGRVVVREEIAPPVLSLVDRLAYYSALKQQLQAVVRSDRRLEHIRFSTVVQIRVGAEGRISDIRIDRHSGNRTLDGVLTDALAATTVSQPPRGLPQPLSITLTGQWRDGVR